MMMLIIVKSKAPIISNFMKVGAISGGIAIRPFNLISPKKTPIKVTVITPIIIAPVILRTASMEINRNPKAARRVSV